MQQITQVDIVFEDEQKETFNSEEARKLGGYSNNNWCANLGSTRGTVL